MTKVQTERTSKKFKLQMVLAFLLFVVSGLGALAVDDKTGAAFGVLAVVAFVSLAWLICVKVAAWWQHG